MGTFVPECVRKASWSPQVSRYLALRNILLNCSEWPGSAFGVFRNSQLCSRARVSNFSQHFGRPSCLKSYQAGNICLRRSSLLSPELVAELGNN